MWILEKKKASLHYIFKKERVGKEQERATNWQSVINVRDGGREREFTMSANTGIFSKNTCLLHHTFIFILGSPGIKEKKA